MGESEIVGGIVRFCIISSVIKILRFPRTALLEVSRPNDFHSVRFRFIRVRMSSGGPGGCDVRDSWKICMFDVSKQKTKLINETRDSLKQ